MEDCNQKQQFYDRHYLFRRHAQQKFYSNRHAGSSAHVRTARRLRSFKSVISPENLLRVFHRLRSTGGFAPGIDGLTYTDFSTREIAEVLRVVSAAIKSGSYEPYPTRSVLISKGDGRYRELQLAIIVDRVVATAVYEAIARTVDRQLLPCSFGFRSALSTWHLLARLEWLMVNQDLWIVATDDVADAFPSCDVRHVFDDFHTVIPNLSICRLVETSLRGDRGDLATGLPQGNPLAPSAMNLRMLKCLDRPYYADPANPPLLRYADNLVFAARSVTEGWNGLRRAEELLDAAGLRLKGKDGPPVNLRRQGAAAQVLGFAARREAGRMRLDVPRQAWQDLETDLAKARAATNSCQLARAIVTGWLDAMAPALESADAQSVAKRSLAIAGQAGHREIGRSDELETRLRRGLARWDRARRKVARARWMP